jgi:hypothetical protein
VSFRPLGFHLIAAVPPIAKDQSFAQANTENNGKFKKYFHTSFFLFFVGCNPGRMRASRKY